MAPVGFEPGQLFPGLCCSVSLFRHLFTRSDFIVLLLLRKQKTGETAVRKAENSSQAVGRQMAAADPVVRKPRCASSADQHGKLPILSNAGTKLTECDLHLSIRRQQGLYLLVVIAALCVLKCNVIVTALQERQVGCNGSGRAACVDSGSWSLRPNSGTSTQEGTTPRKILTETKELTGLARLVFPSNYMSAMNMPSLAVKGSP